MPLLPFRFQVGDEVTWCGTRGIVTKDEKYKHPEAASLLVTFDEKGNDGRNLSQHFLYDGRLHSWHLEPSLKLAR